MFCNGQKRGIDSGKGFAPNRRLTITWANDELDLQSHVASLGHIDLTYFFHTICSEEV